MNAYVAAGYALTALGVTGYAWRMLRRGRELSRSLPAEERTWH